MDSQHVYWEIKKILREEPELRKEFEKTRSSLAEFQSSFTREGFDMHLQEYEDFIEILINIANLPKIK